MNKTNNKEDILSRNVNSIEISGIRKFFNKLGNHPDAISLTLGQPDFKVPDKVKEAITRALNEDKTGYTSNAGIVELRRAICTYLENEFHINYHQDEVCMTVGGSEALMDVFLALVNPGDRVLIPSPAYPAYESCVKLVGGKVVNYNLTPSFDIDFENLEALIQSQTPKLVVLSYPSNPTGAVLTREHRDRLVNLVKEYNVTILTDEMYNGIFYGDEYFSPAQCEDIRDRIIMIGGFSKTFSMTGLRIGFLCTSKHVLEGIMKAHQYNVSCAPSIVQWGALEGLEKCLNDSREMCCEFKKRRDYAYERLIQMGLKVNLPQGAFYIFPDMKQYGMSSEEFCDRMLKEAKVAAVPGSAFGSLGEGHFRISYACSMEQLKEAMDRMENWIKKL